MAAVTNTGINPSVLIIKEKEEDSSAKKGVGEVIDRTFDDAKDAVGFVKLVKSCTSVAEEYRPIPSIFYEIFFWTKPLKIAKGFFAVGSLHSKVKKFFLADTVGEKAKASWGVAKSLKNITNAVATTMAVMSEIGLIATEALKWTDVLGYVFYPLKVISTGISGYNLGEKIGTYQTFVQIADTSKKEDADTRIAKMVKNMVYVQKIEDDLRRIEVITDDSQLKERTDGILERLRASNRELSLKAVQEGKVLVDRLKDRISARMVSNGIDATLKTAGLTTVTLGFVNPLAAIPAAIVGLALGVITLANATYSKFIPNGDFYDDETPMLYTRALNLLSRAA